MNISDELLFFFSALGSFNGLLLGLYFSFLRIPKHISNFFLGGLLICLSIRIGKSVFFYFHPDLAFSFLQFGLTACFFVGPFLYFYFRSLIVPRQTLLSSWKWHLLALIPIALVVNVYFPFEQNTKLWRPHIIRGIYIVWLAYSLAALPVIVRQIKQHLPKRKILDTINIWYLSIYIGNILIWAAFNFCGFHSYIMGALLFSFMFYLLCLQLIVRSRINSTQSDQTEKYKNKKITEQEAAGLMSKLEQHMATSKIYTDPNIKLADIAKSVNVLPHTLSQLLNDNYDKSFPQFINEYRIAAAKEMIIKRPELTLSAIAYDSGFNSKSTFYNSFKKFTGMTPSAYQKL